jgi:hypothetical protein
MRTVFGILIFLLGSNVVQASMGSDQVIRFPRQMAMGGIGVGLADDEYSLFTNPAGLAGSNSRKFHAVALGVEGSLDTYSSLAEVQSAMSNFQITSLNALMGKDIFFRSSFAPLIMLPKFAVAFVGDVQGAFKVQNQANPSYTVGDMLTYGVQAGMGWSYASGRHPVDEYRFGLSGKILFRRGGYYTLGTAEFLRLAGGAKAYVDQLVGQYATGYGADAGFQYLRHLDRDTDVFAGASLTDIGNTRFSAGTARPIPTNPSIGFGLKKKTELLNFKAGIDFRNLDQDVRFCNKVHIGGETSLPLFDIYAGLNQLNLTYGMAFDIWVLKLTAFSYAEELGVGFHQEVSRRYTLQVDFNMPI